MAKRIANNNIILHREGKRVTVKAGQMFDFTAAEMKDINASSPTALRKPVNEEAEVVEVKASSVITNLGETAANPDASVPAAGGKATSPTSGGKNNPKPVAADKSDEL